MYPSESLRVVEGVGIVESPRVVESLRGPDGLRFSGCSLGASGMRTHERVNA